MKCGEGANAKAAGIELPDPAVLPDHTRARAITIHPNNSLAPSPPARYLVPPHGHFHADGALFFVTFSVIEWLPVFIAEAAFKIVCDSLNFCHKNKGLRTNAFVIMPTHMHAICFHETFQAKALEVLTDFRKFTGRQLADWCPGNLPASFTNVLKEKAGADRERRLWQPSRHPVQIETEPFWRAKFDYLHANPVRKGLVREPEYWRFSSAKYWLDGDESSNDVILSRIEW